MAYFADMTAKKNLLFVINPIAGGKEKQHLHRVIKRWLDHSRFHYEFAYTESVDHARKLSRSAAYLGFDVVAAVGGDGTVNEAARGILQQQEASGQATLSIIPFGSGNGLARHFGIPMRSPAALQVLNGLNTTRIDAGSVNGQPFFCVAGTGFDAHISHLFATLPQRGFSGYVKTALREISRYQPADYKISVQEQDSGLIHEKAFLISIANAAQYGNNAYIAPQASISDGLLDVCILRPFPWYRYPEMAFRLMTGRIGGSHYMRAVKGSTITIHREEKGPVHLDGEPTVMEKALEIKVRASAISVIVP